MPLEQAFTRHAAVQCGFCTPGLPADDRVAAGERRARRRGGDPARARGQPLPLHRLPGHPRGGSRDRGGRGMTTIETPDAADRPLGPAPRRRREAARRGQFAGDIVLPRMLHGKVLRSPVPHARIVSIDTRAAEAMPGVVCVLTYRDLADIDQFWGHAIRDRPVIARRQGALPRRARRGGGRRERGRGGRGGAGDRRRVRGSAGGLRRAAGDRARRRAGARGAAASRPLPRPGRAPAARGQHLLPLPHRPRRGRGRLRARGPGRRGRVHVPRDLPVRDGDAHGRRLGDGGGDHACTPPASTRSSCAPSSRRCSTCRSPGCA